MLVHAGPQVAIHFSIQSQSEPPEGISLVVMCTEHWSWRCMHTCLAMHMHALTVMTIDADSVIFAEVPGNIHHCFSAGVF
jgi:hypothetical protein